MSFRRNLANTPAYGILSYFTDSACTVTNNSKFLYGLGVCVQTVTSTGTVTSSYIQSCTASTSSVSCQQQEYLGSDCNTANGSPTPSTWSLTACTPVTQGLYYKFSYSTTVPSYTGCFYGGFQTSSACGSGSTAELTFAQIQSNNACAIHSDGTSSIIVCTGNTGTLTSFSDGACKIPSGTPITASIGTCFSAAPVYDDINVRLTNMQNYGAFSAVGVPTVAPVSAPAPASSSSSSCLASSETVQLADGSVKPLSQVRLGDQILTAQLDGSLGGFSEVIGLPHADEAHVLVAFIRLSTTGMDVKMTPEHLVLAGACDASALTLVQARTVAVGQCLQTTSGKEMVTAVGSVQGRGVASAVTLAGGLIVVNGIAVSPFAVSHRIGEAWYYLHRTLFALLPAALGSKLLQRTSERFGDLAVMFSL